MELKQRSKKELIINTFKNCLPLIGDKNLKVRYLRAYAYMIALKDVDDYFNFFLEILNESENILGNIEWKKDETTLNEFINVPYIFSELTDIEAKEILSYIKTELKNLDLLEKYLIKKFGFNAKFTKSGYKEIVRQILKGQSEERFNFAPVEGVEIKEIRQAILEHFQKKGYILDNEINLQDIALKMINEKREVMFISVSKYSSCIMFTVIKH
jgi:hypothetical protein